MGSFAPIRDQLGNIVGMHERGADDTLFGQTLAETMTAVVGASTAPAEPDAAPASPARPTWRPGRAEVAGIVGGLFLAALLIAALNRFAPAPAPRLMTPTATAAPTARPTLAPTPALQDAYASPGGALLGTIPLSATVAYQHSGWPGWAGIEWQGGVVWVKTDREVAQLPDLAPPPTAVPRAPSQVPPAEAPAAAPAAPPVCTLDNAPYVAVREVIIGGVPLEQVRAASCASQAEAEAKAAALHDQILAEATAAAEEPAPTPSAR